MPKKPQKKLSTSIQSEKPEGYEQLFQRLKTRIEQAQIRAGLAVNRELVLLYWNMGQEILEEQRQKGWGAKVIDRLSGDLRQAFPEIKGVSPRNLKYIRAFAEAYPNEQIVQEVLAQIPWYHNLTLLEKLSDEQVRMWYARKAIECGWSRNTMVLHIESKLHLRQGQAITNFEARLPKPESDLAREILKNPYNFDFLSLDDEAHERDIEKGLVDHIQRFLLELGVGFAFVGRQYHLDVGDQDFYIDLLFYHLRLRCFVVIELKGGDFKPEFVGQLNFYLSAVDDLMRHPDDKPSIGLMLCKTKNKLIAEYALRDFNKPMGISEFLLNDALPTDLKGSLPTIEELEAELQKEPILKNDEK